MRPKTKHSIGMHITHFRHDFGMKGLGSIDPGTPSTPKVTVGGVKIIPKRLISATLSSIFITFCRNE